MLIDLARIFVSAGKGGNGSASFRREKFAPLGGPDGGDGGRGGDVKLRVAPNLTSLVEFQYNQRFKAPDGQQGLGKKMHGRSGKDLIIKVPPGTIIWDDKSGELIADLVADGDVITVARGGRGGLGNTHFKNSVRQAPRIAELGEPAEERTLRLELRLIADVGLVGLPNAGKSTLLAASTRATPKIADYPFTTLEPNLGVVLIGGRGGQVFVMADVPGLIEGAAQGAGLGHEFLRHISRTRVLVHVVDTSGGLEGSDPVAQFETIQSELKEYEIDLSDRPLFVALNKTDLQEAKENLPRLRKAMKKQDLPTFEISAATGKGVPGLLQAIAAKLREIEQFEKEHPVEPPQRQLYTLEGDDEEAWTIERVDEKSWIVRGVAIERLAMMTNWDQDDAVTRFQRVLERSGIEKQLKRDGVKTGDTVAISDQALLWGELEELEEQEPKRRTAHQRRYGADPAQEEAQVDEA